MPGRTSTQVREQFPAPGPLLARAVRPLAAALVVICVAVTVFLGDRFVGQGRPGRLDMAVDHRIRAALGWHQGLLKAITAIGDPIPVIVMIAALAVACWATHRRRAAVLAAVAAPVAAALTEVLLKPLVGRTIQGGLSFPSGHTTGMFAVAGTCAVLLLGPGRPRIPAALRLLLTLAAYLMAAAVAVAMVGLGAHYFTDTVAGAAVGTAVVLVAALILDRLGPSKELRRAAPVDQPVPARAGRDLLPGEVRAADAGRPPRCRVDRGSSPASTGRATGSRIRCSR
jgi:membrane-associated phospholipid phosphatase